MSPEAQTEAIHYLRIVSLSYPFLFIMQVSCYALHAAGKTLPALGVVGLASVIGGLSSWALAAGCGSLASLGCGPGDDLGFEGIALGGALGFALAGVFALRLLIHGCGPLRLERAWPRLNWLTAKQIFALGAPTAAGSVAVLGCSFWHLGLVARLGDGALAAHGVAVHCEWLSRLVGDAFAVAAASFVGQYLGAGRPDLAYRAAWRALLSGGSCMMAMGALFISPHRPCSASSSIPSGRPRSARGRWSSSLSPSLSRPWPSPSFSPGPCRQARATGSGPCWSPSAVRSS